jgi:hypothetical protein
MAMNNILDYRQSLAPTTGNRSRSTTPDQITMEIAAGHTVNRKFRPKMKSSTAAISRGHANNMLASTVKNS